MKILSSWSIYAQFPLIIVCEQMRYLKLGLKFKPGVAVVGVWGTLLPLDRGNRE